MSDIQRERELRRLEASFGLDNNVEGESSPASKRIVSEPVIEQAEPVVKKDAEAGKRIIKQTAEAAEDALKRLPTKKTVSRKKPIYICVGTVLLAGAGIIAFNFMDDEKGSAAPTVAITPSQGLSIPPAVNQVPTLPGRVQGEERELVDHLEEAIPQDLPLIVEAAPLEPVQPPVSSADEDKGGVQNTVPAQTIAPAPAAAPQVRSARNTNNEAKVDRQPAVVAAPRVIQRHQPPPATEAEIKDEVDRVKAGKPWQSRIDQIKELDL